MLLIFLDEDEESANNAGTAASRDMADKTED
jgi:hypothetical protein